MAGHAAMVNEAARFSWAPMRRPALDDHEYADFPRRAAAWVLDLALAAIVVYAVAPLLGWLASWERLNPDDPLTMLGLLGMALIAVLPTTIAAWLWRRFGATPVQARFGLEVTHWLTGERLSWRAAFARWVLLYAPLALLVAYPQVVQAAFSTWGGGFDLFWPIVELPLPLANWLPLAAMALPLAWYVALAYPALADRRRVRGLHDRVCRSVVVRAVGDRTSRTESTVEGERQTSLSELVPFAWFARRGQPALFWLFVAGAVAVALVGAIDILETAGDGLAWLPLALSLVATVSVVLLPAALLWRVPDAPYRHPLLLIGLGIAAALAVLSALVEPIGRFSLQLAALLAPTPWTWLAVLAPPLVGLGLLTMRRLGPTRPRLLLGLAALYLAMPVAEVAVNAQGMLVPQRLLDVLVFGVPLLYWLGAAFAVWVPVSAWLDGEQPRRFWGLLALALPLQALYWLAVLVVALAATPEGMAAVQPLVSIVAALALAAIALISLVAYGRFAPRD